jgi:hypothetical protein
MWGVSVAGSIDIGPRLMEGRMDHEACPIDLVWSREHWPSFLVYQNQVTCPDHTEVHGIGIWVGRVSLDLRSGSPGSRCKRPAEA